MGQGTTGTQPIPWAAAFPFVFGAGRAPVLRLASLSVLQALLPLAGLVALQRLIDAVAGGLGNRTPTDEALHDATLAVLAAAAVAFLGSALRSLASVASENHGRRLTDAVTLQVQRHAANLDLADFDRPAFHDLLQRAGAEASQRPVRLVQDCLAVLVALVGLLTMAFWLAHVALWLPALVAATILPLHWMRRRHAQLRLDWQERHVGMQRDIGTAGLVLAGRSTGKDVRVLGLGDWFANRLERLRGSLRESLGALAFRRARDELGVSVLGSAGLFVAYYVLARQALAGGLSLGELVLQAQVAQRVQNGVRDLLSGLAGVREHRQFLAVVVAFLARKAQLGGSTPPRVAAPPPGWELREVHFRYPEAARDALSGVSFTVAAGERIAVVGANGSGKSTLVKLLARLYDANSGTVACGGEDVRMLEAVAHRARLSVLLQDAAWFELSIREQFGFGRSAPPSDAEIASVLAVVGLGDAVRALPQGLDTVLSARIAGGVEWSPGMVRRLLLARALLPGAGTLVLDEPFAALDPGSAMAVATYLASRPRTQTVVLVDHRLECLRFVDRVLVLQDGRLVDSGSPTELAARLPAFASLRPV
ncbi:MAG: ABC transporter ATP-binding protein [Planctomycetes bacterium]|nr:ABC transporter ATP-binding protein [Planctomycetota bacterium]